VGRRRLLDAGLEAPPLLAASGEALPFEDGRFDLVVCLATLEFVGNPGRLLDESARVLRPGGSLVLSTVNRFSLGKEPHVDLWGVGFLPRTWQGGYVRARGRGDSWGLRLFSFRELIRLARARFATVRLEPAELPEALALTPAGRLALRTYDRMRTLPFARGLLRRIGPEWDACFVKA
jgi:SAM-dependent methyltransferase